MEQCIDFSINNIPQRTVNSTCYLICFHRRAQRVHLPPLLLSTMVLHMYIEFLVLKLGLDQFTTRPLAVGELSFDKHKKYIASSPANLRRTSYLRTSSAPRLSILFNSPMIHSILLEQHIHFSTSTLLRGREMQHLYPTCSYWRAQRVRLPLLPFPTAFRKV